MDGIKHMRRYRCVRLIEIQIHKSIIHMCHIFDNVRNLSENRIINTKYIFIVIMICGYIIS
jgi:hypothetical protein